MSNSRFTPNHRIRLSVIVLTLIFVIAGIVLFTGSYSYDDIDAGERLAGPNSSHLFGIDSYGRDYLTRVSLGAFISIGVKRLI